MKYYIQWRLLNYNNTNQKAQQNNRFDVQTKLWEKMFKDKPNTEIIIMGDFNINSKIWNKNVENLSEYDKSFLPMSKMVKEKILDYGFTMMINKETRGKAILDHMYTNKVEKINSVDIDRNTTSDHSINSVIIKMKVNTIEEPMINTRNFKIINYEEINYNIINSENYNKMLTEEDPDVITNDLIEIINKELDKQSKEKKFKIKEKITNKYSQETIHLIERNNKLYKEFESNKTTENMVNLKNIKIELKSRKNKEVFINNKKKFEENKDNPKEAWRESKSILYGRNNNFTDRILENGNIKIGSKSVSNMMNRYYIRKIKKYKRKYGTSHCRSNDKL